MPDNIKHDDKNALKEALQKDVYLVDVRTDEEFKGGSVKNADNIPLDQISDRLSEFEDKDNIVVFCRSGNRSNKAKQVLQKNGVDHVLNGGNTAFLNAIIEE